MLLLHELISGNAALAILGIALTVLFLKLIVYGVGIKYLSLSKSFRNSFVLASLKIGAGIIIAIAFFAPVLSSLSGSDPINSYVVFCLVRFIEWIVFFYSITHIKTNKILLTARNGLLLSILSIFCDLPLLVMFSG
jgi:hypothetical protein